MAKDPSFLFYSQDFLVGCSTLSFEDRGKYITILATMHQKGRLSEEEITFLVGSFSKNLKSKFKSDKNGLFFNKRLEEEVKKRAKYTQSRRKNGLLGGRPKKNHMVNHMQNHMGTHMENENISNNNKGVRGKKAHPPSAQELQDVLTIFREKKVKDPEGLLEKFEAWIVNNRYYKDYKAAARSWAVDAEKKEVRWG